MYKGILDKADIKKEVQEIREEASNHQTQLESYVKNYQNLKD